MIIQAELKCKQTGGEADPCAVAAWILRNTSGLHGNDCVTEAESGLPRRFDPPFPVQQQEQRMM